MLVARRNAMTTTANKETWGQLVLVVACKQGFPGLDFIQHGTVDIDRNFRR